MGSKKRSKAKKTVQKKKPVKKTSKPKAKPKAAAKPVAEKEEKITPRRNIEPPVKLVGHPTSMIVFGMHITEPKVRAAAIEAYRKRLYTTDDINITEFLGDKTHDNLMVKIALLDRVHEMVKLLYPNNRVERKNKITLVID